jgi:hypothetical protein
MRLQSPQPVCPEQPQGRVMRREVSRIRERVEAGPGLRRPAARPAAVHCGRCRGLMYRIQLQDWGGGRGQGSGDALQCIACGDIIDPVIARNRRCSRPSRVARRKRRERVAMAL